MYLDFYQLKQAPFPSTPEPAHLFLSPSHQRALAAITSGVVERQGFVLITGAGGVGKTTILRAYLAQGHPAQLTILVIANAQVTFPELLTTLCQTCGLEATGQDLFAMQTQFQQFLLAEYRQGRNMAMLIDDAHRMPLATLEQLWLLANLDIVTAKLVQIVLIGQPDSSSVCISMHCATSPSASPYVRRLSPSRRRRATPTSVSASPTWLCQAARSSPVGR